MRRRIVVALIAIPLLVTGCGGAGSSPAAGESLRVVATTTVLADLVRNVGGANVTVVSLVPKGGEPHTFDPSPSDLQRVAQAQLVVANGLGLDDWLSDLVRDSGAKAPVIELAVDLPGVAPIPGDEGSTNPHLWLNVANAQGYVQRIADAVAGLLPAHRDDVRARADGYLKRLAELDQSIADRFGALPAANRRVVSFHDAFAYFAHAYGLEVVGVVVKAPGQEPSAGELADLIAAIRRTGVKAILSEVQFSDRVVRQIAAETGATVVSDLYTDSLGDPPVDTYEAMLRWDADRLIDALR